MLFNIACVTCICVKTQNVLRGKQVYVMRKRVCCEIVEDSEHISEKEVQWDQSANVHGHQGVGNELVRAKTFPDSSKSDLLTYILSLIILCLKQISCMYS